MNLYRNFGCMLETWVAHGYPDPSRSSEEALEKRQDANSDSTSASSIVFTGTTLRSESEDSGVDLSNVGSSKASRSMVLTSEDSLNSFSNSTVHEITEEDVQPASSSSLSLCSSSSSCFSETQGSQNSSTAEDQTSEDQTLKRISLDPTPPEPTETESLENVPDGRPCRSCDTTTLGRGLHTEETELPHTQPADQDSPSPSVQQVTGGNGDPVEGVYDGLSPGLVYLKQVCRMLEEIARLQQHNQSLQLQVDSIRVENEAVRTQESEIRSTFNKRSDLLCLEDQSRLPSHGFRHRTVSDTWAFLKHRRKPKVEHFSSTDVLTEEPDRSLEPQDDMELKKKRSSLKQMISSLKNNDKINHSRSSSLHGEKSMLRLFRNRRKTTRL